MTGRGDTAREWDPSPPADGVRELLAEVLDEDPGVVELTAIAGGASRETWLVTAAEDKGAPRRWVLRRDPPGSESLVPMRGEYALIEAAARAGVPVAEPLAIEPPGGRFGTAGMLVGYVEGTSIGPRILRKPQYQRARERLTEQLATALARLHALGESDLMGALPPSPRDPVLGQIEEWERQLDEIGEPLPTVELGLRWLRAHLAEPDDPALVHGDFRLGNFIADENGLRAVIDWELAHLGDPAEDVGWLCIRTWRFGNDEQPVAGVGDLDQFVFAYEAAGGRAIDRERLPYWEVFGNVKWAIICARQARDHLTGVRRSHELASLGRRVCEPEWDLLELIGEPAAAF